MIRKTELTDKIEAVIKDGGYDERLSYLLNWADSLPDDVPQDDGYRDTALALALQLARSKVYEGDLKHFLYADGWQDALNHFESLMKNHAGSNEPGFGPKTAQDLSQKADESEPLTDLRVMVANARVLQPEPSGLEVALRLYPYFDYGMSDGEIAAKAVDFVEAVRAEEARRAGK